MSAASLRSGFVRPPGPVARGLRIGLLGGSFNPAHEGHLHASRVAMKRLRLDYVWWLVSPQNPLKPSADMAVLGDRIAAARKLAANRRIVVTGIEEALGTRYTIDTIARLRRRFPAIRFVWLMGSDNLLQIPRWRRWRALFRAVPIAAVTRPDSALGARTGKAARVFDTARARADAAFPLRRPPAWTILEARRNPASATRLRAQ